MTDMTQARPNRLERQRLSEVPAFARPWFRSVVLRRAVATLSAEQRALMQASDKGEVNVPVAVTDEAGVNPVECEFVWAWIPSGPRK